MTEQQAAKNRRVEELMGISLKAETDAEIAEAVAAWLRKDGNVSKSMALEVWNDVGGPFREELEAHVATWRKPPRDFCNDLNRCEEMQRRIIQLDEDLDNVAWNYVMAASTTSNRVNVSLLWDMLHLSAEARVDAALSAWDASQAGEAA